MEIRSRLPVERPRRGTLQRVAQGVHGAIGTCRGVQELESNVTPEALNDRLKPHNGGHDVDRATLERVAARENKRNHLDGLLALASGVAALVAAITDNSTAGKVAAVLGGASAVCSVASSVADAYDESKAVDP